MLQAGPSHLFLFVLHLLLHAHTPIFSLGHPQECGEIKLLGLRSLYHSEYLLELLEPCVSLIWGGFPSEFRRLMTHEILHGHRSHRRNHGSGWCCYRLHRIHHLVDCVSNLISPNGISSPPVCHCLWTPHISAVKIKQLKIKTYPIKF